MVTSVTITSLPYANQQLNDAMISSLFSAMANSGVVANPQTAPLVGTIAYGPSLNTMQVTPTSSTSNVGNCLTIDTGAAMCGGVYVEIDTPILLDMPINLTGYTRVDAVVIRVTWGSASTNGTAIVTVKTGFTDGSLNPPSRVAQPGAMYELPLALVSIPANTNTNTAYTPVIEDMRFYFAPSNPRSSTILIAAPTASAQIKQNADITVPVVNTAMHVYGAEQYINYAIQQLASGVGGTVQLSEGIFTLMGPIVPAANVQIKGMGLSTIVQMSNTITSLPCFFLNGVNSVTISDMTIDGGANNTGWYSNGSSFVSTYNSGSTGTYGGLSVTASGIWTYLSEKCTYKHLNVANCRDTGIYLHHDETVAQNRIIDCVITDTTNYGIVITGGDSMVLNNFVMRSGIYGIAVRTQGYITQGMSVKGNNVSYSGYENISVVGDDTAHVIQNCLISQNTVHDASLSGTQQHAQITVQTAAGCSATDIDIKDNKIYCENNGAGSQYPGWGVYCSGSGTLRTLVANNDCLWSCWGQLVGAGGWSGFSGTRTIANGVHDASGVTGANAQIFKLNRIGLATEANGSYDVI